MLSYLVDVGWKPAETITVVNDGHLAMLSRSSQKQIFWYLYWTMRHLFEAVIYYILR